MGTAYDLVVGWFCGTFCGLGGGQLHMPNHFTMVVIDRRAIGPYSYIASLYHTLHRAYLANRHK